MLSKAYTTSNPTIYTSPRADVYKDPTAENFRSSSLSPLSVSTTATVTNGDTNNHYLLSNYYDTLLTALSRYLPSNEQEASVTELTERNSDDFKMYEFKVRRCTSSKAHDWTECPFVHPGEKARRRDPRRFSYSGTACTDYRKGNCRRGDACDFAHGVFECWLHPTRYRTQVCKDGSNCTRRVCFFAHSPDQLRVTSGQPSPVSIGSGSSDPFDDGLELSPPLTPVNRARPGCTVGDLVATLRNLQLSKVKSMTSGLAWNNQMGLVSPRFGPTVEKAVQTGFYSLPTTPTRITSRSGESGYLDAWEKEPVFERPVENSRRQLSRERQEDMQEPVYLNPVGPGPDIGWVSELLQ